MLRFALAIIMLIVAISAAQAQTEEPAETGWNAALKASEDAVANILLRVVDAIEWNERETEAVRDHFFEENRKLTTRVEELEADLQKIRVDWSEANSLMLQIPEVDRSAIVGERLRVVRDRTQETVWAAQDEPLVIEFEAKILGGFKPRAVDLGIEKADNRLIVFLRGPMRPEGAAIVCSLENGKFVAIRIREATGEHPADVIVRVGVDS